MQKRNTYMLVADRLLDDLRAKGAVPGEMLPTERELTERFGVGRSSIREALRMLESQGVIVLLKHGQFAVGSTSTMLRVPVQTMLTLERSDLRDVFELRQMLEPSLAEYASSRATEEDLAAMSASIDAMSAAIAERESMLEADLLFHRAIAKASGNRLGCEVVDALHTTLRDVLRRGYYVSEDAVQQHRAILAAIRKGSGPGARRAMEAHMAWISQIVDQESN